MRVSLIKQSGEGEQLSIDGELEELTQSGKPLLEVLRPYFKLVDDRLMEVNKRVIAANFMIKKLPAEAQMALHNIIDVLHGAKPGPEIEQVVSQAADELQRKREAALAEAAKGTIGKANKGPTTH